MRFDFTGYECFIAFLQNRATLSTVMANPAYRMVSEHARRFGDRLSGEDVIHALQGKPSPFYGLNNLRENLDRIETLQRFLQAHEDGWRVAIEQELQRLLPDESLAGVVVYPIIGYDMGIGLCEAICLNLNTPQYLEEPAEFFYFVTHEMVHVLYERSHAIASLREVTTPEEWLDTFGLWLQNEGFAVYAPLRLRRERDHLNDRDYQVLFDPAKLADSLRIYHKTLAVLRSQESLNRDQRLDLIFGSSRILYRAGYEIFRRIEQIEGQDAVRSAFYLSGGEFLRKYGNIVFPKI